MFRALIVFGVLGLFLAVTPAEARSTQLSTRITQAQLNAICTSVGGTFGWDPSGYGCTKKNCDGKGHDCTISCSQIDNQCWATTPSVVLPKSTVKGILLGNGTPRAMAPG
jgi:hypothetical protein